MYNTSSNDSDKEFVTQLRWRVKRKIEEYGELLHKQKEIEIHLERVKAYIEELNKFLEHEGQRPELLKAYRPVIGIGKTGNRAKGMPLRKTRWEGMSINEIIQTALKESPNRIYKPNDLASEVYEINSDADLRMVLKNFRSMLQRGARDGLWDKSGRAQYKTKVNTEQGQLINT
jgi:hypothetical protein